MGITQAEVKLRRMLAATPHQGNQTKLLSYVESMREQLALLSGGGLQTELPIIPAAQAKEYEKSIEKIAEKIDPNTAHDVWESLRGQDDKSNRTLASETSPELDQDEQILAPQTLSPTLRRRRLMREHEEGKSPPGLKLDPVTQQLMGKHRQIQEALTDEMAELSGQMKNNSLIMEQTLRGTAHLLDSTEEAVEHSLSATNRVNERAGIIYKSNWKTSCFTWLMLILMILIFCFMVLLIRITG